MTTIRHCSILKFGRGVSNQLVFPGSTRPLHATAWTSVSLSVHPSIECKCTALQIETPISIRCTTTHQFIWQQQHTCDALGRSPMERRVGGQPCKTSHFHLRHRHPPHGVALPRTAWVRFNRLGTGVGRIHSNRIWPPLRPVSVAQKNKLSTILSGPPVLLAPQCSLLWHLMQQECVHPGPVLSQFDRFLLIGPRVMHTKQRKRTLSIAGPSAFKVFWETKPEAADTG